MKAIYPPTGKAKEYGCWACNLYSGCGHRCPYCFAPSVIRMDRQEFYNNPQPREGIIEALRKDAAKLAKDYYGSETVKELDLFDNIAKSHGINPKKLKPPEVFLCFTCDPYQPINEKHQLARQAIEILHANELGVNILTKGIITDFDLLSKRPDLSRVGVTFDGYSYRGCPVENKDYNRDVNLAIAKRLNIKTWVSMEPVIYPEQVIQFISSMHSSVDEFKIGKWNYDKRANDIDWYKFTNEAIELLEKLGCNYYIKDDLKKYIKG